MPGSPGEGVCSRRGRPSGTPGRRLAATLGIEGAVGGEGSSVSRRVAGTRDGAAPEWIGKKSPEVNVARQTGPRLPDGPSDRHLEGEEVRIEGELEVGLPRGTAWDRMRMANTQFIERRGERIHDEVAMRESSTGIRIRSATRPADTGNPDAVPPVVPGHPPGSTYPRQDVQREVIRPESGTSGPERSRSGSPRSEVR